VYISFCIHVVCCVCSSLIPVSHFSFGFGDYVGYVVLHCLSYYLLLFVLHMFYGSP
jgi:hypothetical protein